MDSTLSLPKGIYHDRIITAQGRVIELGWRSNIVVDRCRYLLASFMKGDRVSGIRVLIVGRGEEGWDTVPPTPPQRNQITLTDPAPFQVPVRPNQMVYLDAAGNSTDVLTNRIQIKVTFAPGTPPIRRGETTFPLREFGLFGRLGGEDYMIDYVRHPVVHKRADETLVRTIRLIF